MSDNWNDVERGDFAPADYCRSRDPYCSRNPQHVRGTPEEYSGALCGDCEDQQIQDDRDRNTIPAGMDEDED